MSSRGIFFSTTIIPSAEETWVVDRVLNKALSFGIPCICDILWSGCQFGIIGFHRVSCCRYVYED